MDLIGPVGLAIATLVFLLALRLFPGPWMWEGIGSPLTMNLLSAKTKKDVRFIMSILVSIVLGGAALYYVFSPRYAGQDKEWATGVLGGLFGHWVKK